MNHEDEINRLRNQQIDNVKMIRMKLMNLETLPTAELLELKETIKSQQERIAELESLLKEIIDKYIRWQPITDTTESHYQRQEILSKASRLLGEKDK